MKRFIYIVTIILGIIGGVATTQVIRNPSAEPSTYTTSVTNAPVIPTATPTPEIQYAKPVRIIIPKLNVDALIEDVAQDQAGAMDVPKDFNNVGWYSLGVKPGEKGNAVLAGHLDTPTGSEAVFYGLSTLKPGDTIQVKDENNNEQTFIVRNQETYETKEFPLEKVFGTNDKKYLNLITCEGTFDQAEKLYSERLVVYAELQES